MWGLPMLEKKAKAKAICESDETDQLEELITDFMSDPNGTRSDARSIFEICIYGPNPHVFANKLYRVLSSSLDLNSCTISAILLRKTLISKYYTPFLRFPAETQSTLKRGLLKLVDTSVDTPTRPISKELCHTVSALAASLLPKKEWPEFLTLLVQLIASDKKRALLIGAHLAQYLRKGLKELHSVKLDKELHSVLLQCLKTMTEGEGEDVRIAVWGIAINFILCLEQKDLVNFQDLLTTMMSTLKKALYSGNETMAVVNTLKLLINLAGVKPTFFRNQIVEMVKTILLMADDDSLEKETRRLAIEFVLTLFQFVLTLAKVEKTNSGQLKLGTEFEINVEKTWDDNEETDNYGSWQECVDRLSILSDRNDILTVALEVLPAYLAAPKGQKRHAELIALSKSIITWDCRESLEKGREWDVRVAALGAAINFFPCPDLLTSMLSMLDKVLEDRDEVMAREVLKLLIELGEPRLLMGQIMGWVKIMWQIANNDSLNVGTRRLAIEFLLKLAQVHEIAPWLKQNVRMLFEILMNVWDYINDDDPNADHVHAWESSNNRFWWKSWDMLFVVDGNGIFSVALEVLPAYLDAPEWQKKHAAVIVLTKSIESCPEVTIENLKKVVPIVLSPFQNANCHVRRAAIEAIQQLIRHFRLHGEVMRTKFEQILSKLLSLFQDDDPVMQTASIRAIMELASTFGDHLQVGCHLVLPALAAVMEDSPNQDMRGSAASAILVFSEYCTWDNLREHLDGSISSCLIVSKEVKELATKIRFRLCEWQERLSEAWKELWRNEEWDFSPYLKILMSPVFDSAVAELNPDERWHDVIILEKAQACRVLCFCVSELGELLVPEINQVVDTLIPFLKWDHDPPLADARVPSAKATRIAAASARAVVESSHPEDYDHKKQHFEMLSDKVKRALEDTSDVRERDRGEEEELKSGVRDSRSGLSGVLDQICGVMCCSSRARSGEDDYPNSLFSNSD